MATLTYVYADQTAVLGPLATYAEPHCYDLCQIHSERMTVPRGWEVVRLEPDPDALRPSSDDLEALANAFVAAYKRSPNAAEEAIVNIDPDSGDVQVISVNTSPAPPIARVP